MASFFKDVCKILYSEKIYLIICFFFFTAGLISALFYELPEDSFFFNLSVLFDYFSQKTSISYYVIKFLSDIFILFIIFLSGFILFTFPVHFVIFIYRGFFLGITVRVLAVVYSAAGIVVSLFVVLPSALIVIASNVFCSTFMLKQLKVAKNCSFTPNFLCYMLVCALLSVLSLLWEILAPLIIVRPLNYFM